jgi:hypothetical protein
VCQEKGPVILAVEKSSILAPGPPPAFLHHIVDYLNPEINRKNPRTKHAQHYDWFHVSLWEWEKIPRLQAKTSRACICVFSTAHFRERFGEANEGKNVTKAVEREQTIRETILGPASVGTRVFCSILGQCHR